ncbi:Uncharacterized protein Fot_04449 [Forsythia ovata]|uniref:Uncharacterized protein n=1 Tax=Forsythia ovata TaxID=205694 RepID=A0ABD1XCK2_9LAMI
MSAATISSHPPSALATVSPPIAISSLTHDQPDCEEGSCGKSFRLQSFLQFKFQQASAFGVWFLSYRFKKKLLKLSCLCSLEGPKSWSSQLSLGAVIYKNGGDFEIIGS